MSATCNPSNLRVLTHPPLDKLRHDELARKPLVSLETINLIAGTDQHRA